MSLEHTKREAKRLISMGFILTPPFENKTKAPKVSKWNTPQVWIDSPRKVKEGFTDKNKCNFGVILEPSGLVSLDIDDYSASVKWFAEEGYNLDGILGQGLGVQGNPQGHAKAIFRTTPGFDHKYHKLDQDGETIFELRAGKKQDVMPPSIHPKGVLYKWLDKISKRSDIPFMPPELLDLWANFEELNAPQSKKQRTTAPQPRLKSQKQAVEQSSKSYFSEIRKAFLIKKLIGIYAPTKVVVGGILCPFHEEQSPSFSIWEDEDGLEKWTCHHGGAPVGHDTGGESHGDVIDLASFFLKKDIGAAAEELAETAKTKRPKTNNKKDAPDVYELIQEEVIELWKDTQGREFATVLVEGNKCHLPIAGPQFGGWLRRNYRRKYEKSPQSETLKSAIADAVAEAMIGAEHEISIRVAEANGNIYVDLAKGNKVVEISRSGWSVVDLTTVSGVWFSSNPKKKALPTPTQGGGLAPLWEILNVEEYQRPLVCGYLVSCFRAALDYATPVLVLQGGQGSGKSVFARILRSLVDPAIDEVRALPKKTDDLISAINNNWFLNFDNVSFLSADTSDQLCMVATGGAFAARKLYSNAEEIVISAKRPICLNGISSFASRPDLLSRAMVLHLPPLEEECQQEGELWAKLEKHKGEILGAIFDAMVVGLNKLPDLTLSKYSRLASFESWATACEEGFGFEDGTTVNLFVENQGGQAEENLSEDSFACALRACEDIFGPPLEEREDSEDEESIFDPVEQVKLTPGQVMSLLDETLGERERRPKAWPATARACGNALRRLSSDLKKDGFLVERPRGSVVRGKRYWTFERIEKTPGGGVVVNYTKKEEKEEKEGKEGKKGLHGLHWDFNVTPQCHPLKTNGGGGFSKEGDIEHITPPYKKVERKESNTPHTLVETHPYKKLGPSMSPLSPHTPQPVVKPPQPKGLRASKKGLHRGVTFKSQCHPCHHAKMAHKPFPKSCLTLYPHNNTLVSPLRITSGKTVVSFFPVGKLGFALETLREVAA